LVVSATAPLGLSALAKAGVCPGGRSLRGLGRNLDVGAAARTVALCSASTIATAMPKPNSIFNYLIFKYLLCFYRILSACKYQIFLYLFIVFYLLKSLHE
jgi:hypothetical protein